MNNTIITNKDKKIGKRFFLFGIIAIFIVTDLTAEETVGFSILYEAATSESKDFKYIALLYIEDAIERGFKDDDILRILDFLISEHIRNPILLDGRVTNDFPDIRIMAVKCLGMLCTIEAYNSLFEMLVYENNEMVLEEIKSLVDGIEMN